MSIFHKTYRSNSSLAKNPDGTDSWLVFVSVYILSDYNILQVYSSISRK